ncbi:MFS transporter [Dyella choica]|uniref:MFS transporter n=2 Tax=Dyella choica TaxID=1927959 RepID=A0A3S0PPS0_9GAMM|nr:MFS transporter [Dyella choica]
MAWSNLFAQFSEQMALAAAPLVAVLLLAAAPSETGWLQTAQTLPFLLLSIPLGMAVDRASRRALMVGSELLRALSLSMTVGLLAMSALNLPWLAGLGFVGAIGTVCYNVAAPALVPSLVPRLRLADANRWLELARSTAYTAGPALGGALVSYTGVTAAYVLAAVLSLFAVMTLAGLSKEQRAEQPKRHPLHDLKEGASFILRHDLLRPMLVTAVFFNTSWFVIQAIYVAYAVRNLGMSPADVGITLGIYGGGMLIGALIAPVLARRVSLGVMIVLGPISGFSAAVLMLLTLWWPSFWLVALSFFLFGAGPILWVISTMMVRQTVTPNALLGRVSAFIVTATFGARPLGAAIGATVATQFGAGSCLMVATGGFLIQLLVITASHVPKLRELPEAA